MNEPNVGNDENVSQQATRPGCITAFVVFMGIGIAVSLVIALATDIFRNYHASAPYAIIASCLIGVVMVVGFWRMKRWAFIVYGLLILSGYIVYPVLIGKLGVQVLPGLVVQIIIFGLLLRYKEKMT